jgi:hypothetical protein
MANDFNDTMNVVLETVDNFAAKSAHIGALPEHEAMAHLELCRLAEMWAKLNRLHMEIAINKMEQKRKKNNDE